MRRKGGEREREKKEVTARKFAGAAAPRRQFPSRSTRRSSACDADVGRRKWKRTLSSLSSILRTTSRKRSPKVSEGNLAASYSDVTSSRYITRNISYILPSYFAIMIKLILPARRRSSAQSNSTKTDRSRSGGFFSLFTIAAR